METYPLEFHDDHPIARIDGRRCLIDTGSPVSLGERPLWLLGAQRSLQREVMGLTVAAVSEMVGTPLDALLGADALHAGPFLFDWNRATISFSTAPIPFEGVAVPTRRVMGIPIVTFRQGDEALAAFLDSGAKLSYMPAERTAGLPSDGDAEDFYPGFGRFTTGTVRATVELGGHAFEARFGVLPKMLVMTLGLAGVGWILGSDVFKQFRVLVDLAASRVTVAPPPA
jgi:hypothetical protein